MSAAADKAASVNLDEPTDREWDDWVAQRSAVLRFRREHTSDGASLKDGRGRTHGRVATS